MDRSSSSPEASAIAADATPVRPRVAPDRTLESQFEGSQIADAMDLRPGLKVGPTTLEGSEFRTGSGHAVWPPGHEVYAPQSREAMDADRDRSRAMLGKQPVAAERAERAGSNAPGLGLDSE